MDIDEDGNVYIDGTLLDEPYLIDSSFGDANIAFPYQVPARDEDPYSFGRLTTFIECSKYFPVRDEALRAHATQIDPDGPWFSVPLAIQQAGWPTEDYQLVVSKVPTMIPENDLFAGLRQVPVVPEFFI